MAICDLAMVYGERAAQQGDPWCQFATGVRYFQGAECEQNRQLAAEWLEKAAGQDQEPAKASAMGLLGHLYCYGLMTCMQVDL